MVRFSTCLVVVLVAAVGLAGAAEITLTDGVRDTRRYQSAAVKAEHYAIKGITSADLWAFPKCGHEQMKNAFTLDDKTVRIDDSPSAQQVYDAFVSIRPNPKLWAVAWTDLRPAVDCSTLAKCDATGEVVCAFINATLGPLRYDDGAGMCGFGCETGSAAKPTFVVTECGGG